jgi:hypothetical protein
MDYCEKNTLSIYLRFSHSPFPSRKSSQISKVRRQEVSLLIRTDGIKDLRANVAGRRP